MGGRDFITSWWAEVQAPYLAFSTITLGGYWGIMLKPGQGTSLCLHLAFAGVAGISVTFFFCGVWMEYRGYFLKVFCLHRLSFQLFLSISFTGFKMVFVFIFYSNFNFIQIFRFFSEV